MTRKENVLKTVHFDRPEYIPMVFAINGASWNFYDQDELQDLIEEHTFLFPGYTRKATPFKVPTGPNSTAGKPFTDDWGCVWEALEDGIVGTVVKHPLESWDDFDNYQAPDPSKSNGITAMNWDDVVKRVETQRGEGDLVRGGLRHGHTFLQLSDIRGYQNLLFDMMDEEPRLSKLIGMVEEFNAYSIKRFLQLGADWMSYPEDLGMQIGPMISPDMFRKYIKPSYKRLMQPARDADCIVHMHSDGDIRELVDELIDGGVQVINLQDLCNGIDWIRDKFTGKVCVDLDIDRQFVTTKGTPQQIDDLIREEVEKLGSKEGGLMMIHGLYPGPPIENVKALMDAMERYAFHYS